MSNTRPPVSDPSTRWGRRIAHLLSRTAGCRNDVDLQQLALDVKAAELAAGRQTTDTIVVHLCQLHLDGSPLSPTLPTQDPATSAAPGGIRPAQAPIAAGANRTASSAAVFTPPNRARHDRFHARFMHRIADPHGCYPTSPLPQLAR